MVSRKKNVQQVYKQNWCFNIFQLLTKKIRKGKCNPKGIPKLIIVCVWRDRRTQGKSANSDRRDGFLEAAKTASQQAVPKLTPKAFKNVTNMKQKRPKQPPNAVKNQVFPRMLFFYSKGSQNKASPSWTTLVFGHHFRPNFIDKGI